MKSHFLLGNARHFYQGSVAIQATPTLYAATTPIAYMRNKHITTLRRFSSGYAVELPDKNANISVAAELNTEVWARLSDGSHHVCRGCGKPLKAAPTANSKKLKGAGNNDKTIMIPWLRLSFSPLFRLQHAIRNFTSTRQSKVFRVETAGNLFPETALSH